MKANSSIENSSQLDRIKIVQALLDRRSPSTYLEVGVSTGACFLRVRANLKIAVDPEFRMSYGRKLKYLLKNPTNFNNLYFEKPSDAFFAEHQELLKSNTPSVILIDGLHTYQQSLDDVKNSLQILPADGVIVMHDCNPLTEAAGYPADSIDHARSLNLKGWNNIWNGDVWKTIVHLRSFYDDLEVHVLNCDHGVGIIRRTNEKKTTLDLTAEQIDNMSFQDLENNRTGYLDLRPADSFKEFMQSLPA